MGTVVSSSRKPCATAEAASAAISSGWSTRFVTCAWMEGRAAHSHLLHRLEDLDRRQEREHLRDLGGRHARDETRDLTARDGRVDEHAREGERVERHGLLGHGDVDATAGDELVEQVEVRLRLAVELDDPPVLDAERRLRVEWARERDEAERRILGNEVVAADRPCRVELGP